MCIGWGLPCGMGVELRISLSSSVEVAGCLWITCEITEPVLITHCGFSHLLHVYLHIRFMGAITTVPIWHVWILCSTWEWQEMHILSRNCTSLTGNAWPSVPVMQSCGRAHLPQFIAVWIKRVSFIDSCAGAWTCVSQRYTTGTAHQSSQPQRFQQKRAIHIW